MAVYRLLAMLVEVGAVVGASVGSCGYVTEKQWGGHFGSRPNCPHHCVNGLLSSCQRCLVGCCGQGEWDGAERENKGEKFRGLLRA